MRDGRKMAHSLGYGANTPTSWALTTYCPCNGSFPTAVAIFLSTSSNSPHIASTHRTRSSKSCPWERTTKILMVTLVSPSKKYILQTIAEPHSRKADLTPFQASRSALENFPQLLLHECPILEVENLSTFQEDYPSSQARSSHLLYHKANAPPLKEAW